MSAAGSAAARLQPSIDQSPGLSDDERRALQRIADRPYPRVFPEDRGHLSRLLAPLEQASADWGRTIADGARNLILLEVRRQDRAYWSWTEQDWELLATSDETSLRRHRFGLVAFGHVLGGHYRLHHLAGVSKVRQVADAVFGPAAVDPPLAEVRATLLSWGASKNAMPWEVQNAVIDLLLRCQSLRLEDITEQRLDEAVTDTRAAGSKSRRRGLFKLSRVLAHKGIISAPLTSTGHQRGPWERTQASVPAEWMQWVDRWRKVNTREPGTVRTMTSVLLVAGRWAADKHPEAIAPDRWTRDMAAEYVADTLNARVGQWAGHNRNNARNGEPLGVPGMANRIDALRGFFCDLIDWEWIKPRFDPRRVISLPLSRRAQLGPNPRIIDDATWAKLMAAGLTLNPEDLSPYGTPRAKAAGRSDTYYPIEMVRAMVAVWLFAGCRIDEIRRLDLDCVRWDEATDEETGETYRICLLRVPVNKTTGEFTKPVDPIVGQVIEAWKLVRPPQPDITDRKTRQPRQHLFTHRGQLVGGAYLNNKIIPALCHKAGIPETDSRGALTSHRARATIATQLLNAREPLSLADLQQWLGHKHAASTRHYAAILQRTLTAAYKRADYFARNVRTIEVLIDRDAILTGAAADGQPWKYYDLGDGYCTYDFFAKCPHRMACARCPFYKPKQSSAGQLLAVKDGIEEMLEQLDLTDDERQALQGDRDAVAALAERLADIPTPAGPTPKELGNDNAFVSLTALRDSLPGDRS
ncbi:tyrosine-type recombinase/integrase [Actinomadura bangladeshensis]|uniref:Tyrosine-type recombinase/integrase n=1 Tax=Actinomadura bangladeshensis TaxID=453573 RepID=A0A6L9QTL7_9ACTN|nr:tyrosine-type recombinase/integrase [Actinomadura bangladeshensis]NEA28476.1 tyrosine-type recombinase/integrase [Actinomadura bangladeshensis]